jgi:CheY-like chemotaxis protein
MRDIIALLTEFFLGYICFIGAVFFLARLFFPLAKDELNKQKMRLRNRKVLINTKMGKALIIDDELEICLMISKYHQNLKFETQYGMTVKEARLKLLSSTYEVVLLDLNLTDGSGYDVVQYRNKLNLTAKIVVISAYDAGANFFLAKPFALNRIDQSLNALNFLPNNLTS